MTHLLSWMNKVTVVMMREISGLVKACGSSSGMSLAGLIYLQG